MDLEENILAATVATGIGWLACTLFAVLAEYVYKTVVMSGNIALEIFQPNLGYQAIAIGLSVILGCIAGILSYRGFLRTLNHS
jgi:cell division protein FtsX